MNTDNYYARHPWHPANFIYAPAARRVMDYLIENTTSYPRCVDGRYLSPGRIITTRRRICHDLGITLRDLVSALNRLDLHHLISRHSNHDTIIITLPLDPDEITPPPTAETPTCEANEVGAQSIAPAQPALTPPQSETFPLLPDEITPPPTAETPSGEANEVGAQSIAPAQPALTLSQSETLPAPPRTFQNPEPPPHPKRPLPLDRPIASPSKPRRGALMFSPMWQHGVPIQANENEPRRGGIVIPSKTAPPLSLANRPHAAYPPIRGAPYSTP